MSADRLKLDAFTDLLQGAQEATQIVPVGLDELEASPVQVRAPFDPETSEEDAGLVDSIRQDGVIQPLLVVLRAEGGAYQIIDGHRRRAGARFAGRSTVPCIVLTLDQVEAAFQTGISNLQRRDLTPLEEGQQYVELMRISGLSARELAGRLGRPERTVQQRVALTHLPHRVRELLAQDRLSVHQAEGCRHEAWGPGMAELAAERALPRQAIDEAMQHLETHPDATPRDAVAVIAAEPAQPPAGRESREKRKEVDYQALITALDVGLSEGQADLLAEYATLEQLDPHAVRWAALVLAGSQTMTAAAAVAYAKQLAGTPVGRALRAIHSGLETLERRAHTSHQLTPNTAVAARQVIRDLTSRLAHVSAALDQATGLSCAGAISRSHHEEEQE